MLLSWLELVLFIMASFRLTRLLIYDKITVFIRRPFHEEVEEALPDGTTATYIIIKGTGLKYWIGELLSCHWCTGIWSSAVLYISWMYWPIGTESVIIILAIAGLASTIEIIVGRLID